MPDNKGWYRVTVSTPWERFKMWCLKWAAILGGIVLVVWLLTEWSNR